jgi:hypothetical protein
VSQRLGLVKELRGAAAAEDLYVRLTTAAEEVTA